MSSPKKHFITLVELIMVLSLLLLVLLPVSIAATMAIKDWHRGLTIRMLQEDLHLASMTIKGIIEEARDYDIVSPHEIELSLRKEDDEDEPKKVVIKRDGQQLIAGNKTIVDCMSPDSEETFETEEPSKSVRVNLVMENEGNRQENSFFVTLRNRP